MASNDNIFSDLIPQASNTQSVNANLFSDLIPQNQQTKTNMFSDLIPSASKQTGTESGLLEKVVNAGQWLNTPLLDIGGATRKSLGEASEDASTLEKIGRGATKAIGDTAGSITSPLSLGLIAATPLTKGKILTVVGPPMIGMGLYEAVKAYEKFKEGDIEGAAEYATGSAISSLFGIGATRYGIKAFKKPVTPLPETTPVPEPESFLSKPKGLISAADKFARERIGIGPETVIKTDMPGIVPSVFTIGTDVNGTLRIKPPTQQPSSQAIPLTEKSQSPIDELKLDTINYGKKVDAFASQMASDLTPGAQVAVSGSDAIVTTGTLPKFLKDSFKKVAQPTQDKTFKFRFSQKNIQETKYQMAALADEYKSIRSRIMATADPVSQKTALATDEALGQARYKLNLLTEKFAKERTGAGRALQEYQRALNDDVIATLKQAGIQLKGMETMKERLPIFTDMWESLQKGDYKAVGNDFVDYLRMNLFSVTSWTLDLISNISEVAGQTVGGVGHDLVWMAKGNPTFPHIRGLMYAMTDRFGGRFVAAQKGGIKDFFKRRPVNAAVEKELGLTASGEYISPKGIFTAREGIGKEGSAIRSITKGISSIFDFTVGAPLYSKGMIDTTTSRISALTTIWRETIKAADTQGLKGSARTAFYKSFQENLPQNVVQDAILNAQKSGFKRSLTKTEESIASSTAMKLLGDVFVRWPFQFGRWAGEMLGYNPALYKKVFAGQSTAEEVAAYLGKTATGWGGVYLLDKMYDRVDFRSMEYVREDDNRVRLSNREPIATGMVLVGFGKYIASKALGYNEEADKHLMNIVNGLEFTSLPFARLVTGKGGLLGSTIYKVSQALKNPQNDPRALKNDIDSIVNAAIPGQSVLSAIESIYDPYIREGIGAKIPGIASTKPIVPSATTGLPLAPRQKMFGVEFNTIGGVPIPGATRVLDPVYKLLARYDMLVYRGPRQPIAGLPPGQIPPEYRRQWIEIFGKHRYQMLINAALDEQWMKSEISDKEFKFRQEKLKDWDSQAADLATKELNSIIGRPNLKIFKQLNQPTPSLPIFQQPYESEQTGLIKKLYDQFVK